MTLSWQSLTEAEPRLTTSTEEYDRGCRHLLNVFENAGDCF